MQEPIASRNGADEWGLDEAKIIDLTLVEVIRAGERDADRTESSTVVGTTYVQPALVGILHWLRRTERVALTKIQRLATKHGLELIKDDDRYNTLQEAAQARLNIMRSRYDSDMNIRLSQRFPLHLKDITTGRLNIQVYSWVHGALVELAYDAGLQLQDVTMVCTLMSLRTIPDVVGQYAPVLREDIDRFWRHITTRSSQIVAV